ncbi:hypothetical protein B0J17DRAFT_645413 [Rhizoctonia solani]|nr:hypothetical protein B0J17DRAFT_645413 [Rhizoctonia solani]
MFNFIAVIALFVTPAIAVPWSGAICVDLEWSFNSRGQSPCWVAAYLAAPCTKDNTFEIPALENGGSYSFNSSLPNACVCNSVVWNLVSACALCQRGLSGGWREWRSSCPDNMVNVRKYPIPIPTGVSVPSWAYYDFTVSDTFNVDIASEQSGLESSAVSVATSTPVPVSNPTSAVTGANGSTSTPNPIKSQPESSSNTGAIIGGVVGGVLGIGIIGLIAFVLARRGRPEELVTNYPQASHQPPMNTAFNVATPMAGHVPSHQFGAPSPPVSTPEYKSYIASHPSTPTGSAAPATGYYNEPLPYLYQSQGAPGQQPYPRAPEL